MKIHEYQAKAILARYGVAIPRGEVAYRKEEARGTAQRLKSNIVVVKAQIHAGGRGKGGGVKLARSADEAAEIASRILGMNLITAPNRAAPKATKMIPAMKVAICKPAMPCCAVIIESTAINAPVGPAICNRVPPKSDVKRQATIAV